MGAQRGDGAGQGIPTPLGVSIKLPALGRLPFLHPLTSSHSITAPVTLPGSVRPAAGVARTQPCSRACCFAESVNLPPPGFGTSSPPRWGPCLPGMRPSWARSRASLILSEHHRVTPEHRATGTFWARPGGLPKTSIAPRNLDGQCPKFLLGCPQAGLSGSLRPARQFGPSTDQGLPLLMRDNLAAFSFPPTPERFKRWNSSRVLRAV